MNSFEPLVSIIIVDYKKQNPYLVECLEAIRRQTYPHFEIILISDYPVSLKYPNLRKKSFGHFVGPAQKRDIGAKMAKGEILAFIDDDAYPSESWLEHLVLPFKSKSVTGVGGPGCTPPGVDWREEASGWASASPVGAGPYMYRFLPAKKRLVDDYPSMNLAVRKSDFISVGGYDSNYWPGEDTKLCLDLTIGRHKKIVYEPQALVFHHRRPLWRKHLSQNGNFGLHRGFFARILPATSLRIVYFLPSSLLLGTILLLVVLVSQVLTGSTPSWSGLIFGAFLLYLTALICNSWWIYCRSQKLFQAVISIPVIFLTHLWYGVRFLQGFLITTHLSR